MKNLQILFSLTLILFFSAAIFAQNSLIKGTEIPAVEKLDERTDCYVYKEYVVRTIAESEGVGSDVEVFKRAATGDANCQTKGKAHLSIKNPDANYFVGLSGKFLFIDSGTAPDSRGLEIYNLTTRRSVFVDEYSEWKKPLTLTANRFLNYESNSAKDGLLKNCKDAAKWKKDGLAVGWMQPRKLDLQTMKAVNVGGLRCMAVQ